MNNIFSVASWEYLTKIRSKWFIISTVVIPLFMLGSMLIPSMMVTGPDTEETIIAIADGTGYLSDKIEIDLLDRYKLKDSRPKYQVIKLTGDDFDKLKEEAAILLDSSYISSYFTLPQEVLDSNRVSFHTRNLGNFREQDQIHSAVNRVISTERMLQANIDPQQIDRLLRDVDFKAYELNQAGSENEGDEMMSYLMPIIFVMMFFFSIFMSAQILMRSVIGERQNRLVEILLSSISSTELMSGKIIGLGLVGLTQLLFFLAVTVGISLYNGMIIISYNQIGIFLLYFIFGYLLWAAVFAAIGSMFDSEQDAQQVASILSIVNIIPVMLASYFMAHPNSLETVVLSHIPFITPYLMVMRIGIEMPPVWQIFSTLGILILSVWICMVLAGKIFRTAILIYGKRPNLPEILQWIKKQ